MESFIEFLGELENVQSFSFQVGYVAALALLLAIVVLAAIGYFVFFRYPRRSAGVPIRAPLGDIFVSAHAVSDLLKALEAEYKDIEIVKVHLLDCKRFLRVEILVDYAIGGENMTEIGPSLQGKALGALKDVFGIDCVRDVAVKVRRAVVSKSSF